MAKKKSNKKETILDVLKDIRKILQNNVPVTPTIAWDNVESSMRDITHPVLVEKKSWDFFLSKYSEILEELVGEMKRMKVKTNELCLRYEPEICYLCAEKDERDAHNQAISDIIDIIKSKQQEQLLGNKK